MKLEQFKIQTPMGWLLVQLKDHIYKNIRWSFSFDLTNVNTIQINQLIDYFEQKKPIENMPMDFSDLSEFSKKVLSDVKNIPFGQVKTYGEVAKSIGFPKASQAVGQALKHNPFVLIIPCHRVVCKDFPNKIGGYLGHMVDKKYHLLQHEQVL